jgi:hypothetical protein
VNNLRSKLKASCIHLGICAVVAVAAAIFVFSVWYPAPLHIAMGAGAFFWLILAVDVVLGPLITFIIFNPAKKSLKFDLTVVALIQVAALLYGAYTMYLGKPVYVVLNKDRFALARVTDIDPSWYGRATTHTAFSVRDRFWRPKLAAVKWPSNPQSHNDLLFSDSTARVDAYVPIEQATAEILKASFPYADLNKYNEGRDQELVSLQTRWQRQGVNELGFVPLRAEQEDMAVLVDRQGGKVLEIVRFAPW